jgi:hypothetical protein
MISGTRYWGVGGVTPRRWVLRSRNVMESNEEGSLQNNSGATSRINGRWELQMALCHHRGTSVTVGL